MALNPYQNIDVGEQKLVAATVMNSREKLVATGHQIPSTAVGNQRSRSQLVDIPPQTSGGKSGKTNGGGLSQMATTAPRGEGEELASGGRMTADLQRVLEGK